MAATRCSLPLLLRTGLADGQPVPEGDEAMLVAILGYVFPESSAEELAASIRGRPGRVSAYS